jgi:hypothetical protein
MTITLKDLLEEKFAESRAFRSEIEDYFSPKNDYMWRGLTPPVERAVFDATPIPESITNIISGLKDGRVLTEIQLNSMTTWLKEQDARVSSVIIYLIKTLAVEEFESVIENNPIAKQIEDCLKKGTTVTVDARGIRVNSLLNYYQLIDNFTKDPILTIRPLVREQGVGFDRLFLGLAFIINGLLLANIIPRTIAANGLDLTKPLPHIDNPGTYPQEHTPRTLIAAGAIKDTSKYYAYAAANKLKVGVTDTVVKATDGKKILYVRPKYTPASVLASKIARIISPEHFASERMLSDGMVASRQLANFRHSLIGYGSRYVEDPPIMKVLTLTAPDAIIAGTGIVDEVNSFLVESDNNIENYGVSSLDPKTAKLVKIDFDMGGSFTGEYEAPTRVQPSRRFVVAPDHPPLIERERYLVEKFQTRLLLSMMPNELLTGLVDKSFDKEDPGRQEILANVMGRTEQALEAFLNDPKAKGVFLESIHSKLPEMRAQLENYIRRHFRDPEQSLIMDGLSARLTYVVEKIQKILPADIIISAPPSLGVPVSSAVKETQEKPTVAQLLSPAQRTAITKLIQTLEKEINSCWPYPNKDRKRQKVDALTHFLNFAEHTTDVSAIFDSIRRNYPDAFKGDVSRRTGQLLNSLRDSLLETSASGASNQIFKDAIASIKVDARKPLLSEEDETPPKDDFSI